MKKILMLVVAIAATVAVGCQPPQAPWVPLDSGYEAGQTGWTPTAPQNPSLNSVVIDNRTIDLMWRPNQPNSYLGTSAETDNLGIAVETGDVVTVHYGLSSSTPDFVNAMPAAGAIRLFAYDVPDDAPGRPSTAPAYQVFAPVGQRHGELSFTVTADATLGYAGLVYDTSNGGVQGRVRFSDMKVDGNLVLFK